MFTQKQLDSNYFKLQSFFIPKYFNDIIENEQEIVRALLFVTIVFW